LPQSRLTAFEADFDSRTILSHMAPANGVASRLAIREFCTRSLLQEEVGNLVRTLVVRDQTRSDNGSRVHTASLDIPAQPRQLRDWPTSLSLPQAYRRTALSEYRPGGCAGFG
jgi:hypothetical protein